MFTGIIEITGSVEKIDGNKICIKAPEVLKFLKKGSSIAVDGSCLTAVTLTKESFEADIMPISMERTIFSDRKAGDLVNLELAMEGGKRFEGHIVSGHVEGVAELLTMKIDGNAYRLIFEIPRELTRYVVKTGSIAINGISLTVADIDGDQLTVSIIPHTWDTTNLHELTIGDKVNLETDLMAKYAEKLMLSNSKL